MTYEELTYFGDKGKNALAIVHPDTKKIEFFNQKLVDILGTLEKGMVLENFFQEDHLLETLVEGLKQEDGAIQYRSGECIVTAQGEEVWVDVAMSYLDQQEMACILYLAFVPDKRESFLKEVVNQSHKAMFLADFNEEITVYHGNNLFYNICAKDKREFESFFKNSFLATLEDVESTVFLKEIRRSLVEKLNFQSDVQISTVHGVKKWYLLELEYRSIGKGVVKLKGIMTPIAHRVEVSNQLENMNRYFEAIQELTEGALFYVNVKNKSASHYSNLLKEAGFPAKMDFFPQCALSMVHPEDADAFVAFGQKMIDGHEEEQVIRYQRGSDCYSHGRFTCKPIFDSEGKLVQSVGRVRNIDEEIKLLQRANFDPLTNALNKQQMKSSVEEILRSSQQNQFHALFFLDLDDFKYVNDNLGHKFGDFLLAELGKRMRGCVRADDLIGRVGGDEFVLLICNIPNFQMLSGKAKQLLSTIAEEFYDGEVSHVIGASVGISVFPEHGKTYEELYHHADKALYRSKGRGKNMATVHPSSATDKREKNTRKSDS